LKPGVTFEQAEADMNNVGANLEKQYPDSNTATRPRLRWLIDIFIVDIRRTLWIIFAVVGAVLLIACANIANLLLARGCNHGHIDRGRAARLLSAGAPGNEGRADDLAAV
jgi:putative ABC transport system permease protein